jgi:competence protein ComEA
VEELDKLPGVGPVKAQAIVDFREKFGVFLSIKDLLKVNGINQDLFDQIEDSITINP